jgi:WhiB family transcriptional regulator, redox-sensing transcriptional regulator
MSEPTRPLASPVMDPEPDPSWRRDAACRDKPTSLFFAERGDFETVQAAKAVCATCPVREPCLEYALAHPTRTLHGVWGGTSPRQRQFIRRRRMSADQPTTTWEDPMTTNGTAAAAHAETIIDNLLRLGVILLPESERGVCWVADGSVRTPEIEATLAHRGHELRPHVIDHAPTIGAALGLFGRRPSVVAWLVRLGHSAEVVEAVAEFHRLPPLAEDEPFEGPTPQAS